MAPKVGVNVGTLISGNIQSDAQNKIKNIMAGLDDSDGMTDEEMDENSSSSSD